MSAAFARIAIGVVVALAASGCTTMVETRDMARTGIDEAKDTTESLLASRPSSAAGPVRGAIVTDVPYVDVKPVPVAVRYPLSFGRIMNVNEPIGVPLAMLAQRIREHAGITITYQTEIIDPQVRNVGGGPESLGTSSLDNLPALPGGLALTGLTDQEVRTGVAISYSGPVKGLLDAIAAATNSHWELSPVTAQVRFFKYKTATYRIPAVQGLSVTEASLSRQSSGGSSDQDGQALNTASTEAKHTTNGSLWGGIEMAVKKLVSPQGIYNIDQVAGTLLVRDVPERMESIATYMNDLSEAMSRQVDVDVNVYRVLVKDNDVRGVSWDVLFQNLIKTSGYNMGLTTVRPDVTSNGLSSAVIKVPELDANGIPNRYGGSQLFLDALSTLGRSSMVTSASVVTSNNQPAPVKVVKRTSYLKETTPMFGSNSGDTISTGPALKPGSVETGLHMYFLPHVQDDGKRMLLKMMISLSTLESLDSYGSGDNKIQLPTVASREFNHQAWLNSGEVFVVAGFSQIDSGLDTESPLDARLWGLGGKSSARNGREMVVITIRPVVTAARSRI